MFNIDIASLRDPGTLDRVKSQISTAAAIVTAFEEGTHDARDSMPFQRGLNQLLNDMFFQSMSPSGDVHQRLVEAYNLGWDTVRLNRGVKS